MRTSDKLPVLDTIPNTDIVWEKISIEKCEYSIILYCLRFKTYIKLPILLTGNICTKAVCGLLAKFRSGRCETLLS